MLYSDPAMVVLDMFLERFSYTTVHLDALVYEDVSFNLLKGGLLQEEHRNTVQESSENPDSALYNSSGSMRSMYQRLYCPGCGRKDHHAETCWKTGPSLHPKIFSISSKDDGKNKSDFL